MSSDAQTKHISEDRKDLPIHINRQAHQICIGESPELIINYLSQKNYIRMDGREIPYEKTIRFSPDLLRGKRPEVFCAAAGFYYVQAKEIAEGIKAAEILRKKVNRTQREVK